MMNMYSLKDVKAQAFVRPFFSASNGTAIRELAVGLADDPTMAKFAKDFELFHVGTWDADIGRPEPLERPDLVMSVQEILITGE